MHLLDLPWEDVVIPRIFPYLGPKDWLSFRALSRRTNSLVDNYLCSMTYLDLTSEKELPKFLLTVSLANFLSVLLGAKLMG